MQIQYLYRILISIDTSWKHLDSEFRQKGAQESSAEKGWKMSWSTKTFKLTIYQRHESFKIMNLWFIKNMHKHDLRPILNIDLIQYPLDPQCGFHIQHLFKTEICSAPPLFCFLLSLGLPFLIAFWRFIWERQNFYMDCAFLFKDLKVIGYI